MKRKNSEYPSVRSSVFCFVTWPTMILNVLISICLFNPSFPYHTVETSVVVVFIFVCPTRTSSSTSPEQGSITSPTSEHGDTEEETSFPTGAPPAGDSSGDNRTTLPPVAADGGTDKMSGEEAVLGDTEGVYKLLLLGVICDGM